MKNVTAIYFSPTGGTKSYVRAVARGIADDFREIDLTNRETRAKEHLFSPDEIAVIGVPVYYGRIPQLPDELLRGLTASHTPAVFVVVYGNREFDDALLELSDLCEKQGFYGAAACAFVAQHTFSPKIAAGRPNEEDLTIAEAFGREIREFMEAKDAKPLSFARRPAVPVVYCGAVHAEGRQKLHRLRNMRADMPVRGDHGGGSAGDGCEEMYPLSCVRTRLPCGSAQGRRPGL